ncbi:hypothetical protein GGTG_03017 [Gaeumannomyces tritici R3-111a-1]|uniref:Uncharacterized protein n=1 Tax=Gaeumannomyces tritici (strain R3-111a-1) TaxID=644352 RepID=J3NP11_GAET3|nr:hypothetical protein GGTG_03017 [Gaeumannomyces tritici R3-111a-1]EJT77914.1 hypothetical protein GGTG_03017 [Gaeumannomyces tritici R3-111a-1]
MKTPSLRTALHALLIAWAPATAALAESSPPDRAVLDAAAAAGPGKLTTTASNTKDGKLSVLQEALRSVVPHASRTGGGGGIPGAADEDVAAAAAAAARQKREQQGEEGGGDGEAIAGIPAAATVTPTTAIAAPHGRAEAASDSPGHRADELAV